MKSFTKKTLSVVFAMLMALTSLTVGAFSASAAITGYTPVNEGTTAVANPGLYSFTPATTGYYSVTVKSTKDGKSTESEVSVSEAENDKLTELSSKYSYYGYYINDVCEYVPATVTVKLTAGETYYINANYSEGVSSTLNIAKSDYSYIGYIGIYDDNYGVTGIGAAISGYVGTSTTIAVPSQTADGYAVKEVSLNVQSEALNKRVTSVTLPEGVTSISGMSGMYALTSVNLPSTLETISAGTFNGDHALTGRIEIPASVEYVRSYAFYDTGITSVKVNSASTEIGDYAFGYNVVLNEATADPTDTTTAAVDGFIVIAPANSLATVYANQNGFTAYDPANCTVGNHPYAVTTVPATIFAKGSTTSVCPVCGNTVKATIKKKKFKIKSLKSTKKNTIVVKAKKQSDIKGYQIQYSTTKKFKKKKTTSVKVKTTKKLSKTIKGLKSGKKYYVRVRAYKTSGKKTVYSTWTKTKSVKVK